MALGMWCSWGKKQVTLSNEHEHREPKSVNIFLGFFFLVNYSLGMGFLAIPYSFLHAGYLIAIPTLLVIVFVSWIHASWVLEVMARAQALESFSKFQKSFAILSHKEKTASPPLPLEEYCGSVIDIHELHKAVSVASNCPDFRVLRTRGFETSELCEIFFNKFGKYTYLITVVAFCFFVSLGLAVVVSSVWATNIPLNFGPFQQCSFDAFHNIMIPEDVGCRYAYYFCLMLFGLIVTPLSIMNLKEQAVIQAMFGLLRFLMIAMILIYCIVKLFEDGDICQEKLRNNLCNTTESNQSCSFKETAQNATAESVIEMHDIIARFDWKWLLVAIPVFTYPFMLHLGIPGLTHPIGKKRYLWQFILCTYGFLAVVFLFLGVVVPLWFRAETQEAVVLNWVSLAKSSCNSTQLRVFSYFIFLLPSVYVISIYAINIQPIANNIYSVFFKQDTGKRSKRCDQLLKVLIRLFAAVTPLAVAFGVSNLVTVLQYSGLPGFLLSFVFPFALQLRSIKVCKKIFCGVRTVQTFSFMSTDSTEKEKSDNMELNMRADVIHSPQEKQAQNEPSLYMTPYSTRILSHPITVIIIGAIGQLLFLLTIAGFFFEPEKLPTCKGCSLVS